MASLEIIMPAGWETAEQIKNQFVQIIVDHFESPEFISPQITAAVMMTLLEVLGCSGPEDPPPQVQAVKEACENCLNAIIADEPLRMEMARVRLPQNGET
jgi:hypothetical protein